MTRSAGCAAAFGLAATFAIGACTDPTVPGSGPAFNMTVSNDAHWETWGIGSFNVCDAPAFLPGKYRVHLVTQTRTLPDGRIEVRQRVNSAADLKLSDVLGGTWIFRQVGEFKQIALPSGPYTAVARQRLREISTGNEYQNQEFVFLLTIVSDGVNPPIVTYEPILGCSGRV